MSIVSDLLSLAGVQPTPAATGERPDAAGFAGFMESLGEPRSRGLMGLGRRLAEQAQAETARMDDNGPLVGGEPLINPGLLTGVQTKPDQPEINPGLPGGGAKPEPQINPGLPVAKDGEPQINPGLPGAKTDGPLINPGVAETKDGGPQINPGEPVAKDGAQVLPGDAAAPALAAEVLGALSQATEPVRAEAAVAAVRQAVGRAPEVSAPEAPAADPVVDLTALVEGVEPEAAPAVNPATIAAETPTASTTAVASTPIEPAPAIAQTDGADTPIEASPDLTAALAEAEVATPATTGETAAPAAARADAVPMHRGAADAIAQVSAQIIRRLEGRATRFDMELNPVELGKVEVRLDIDAEGRLAARLAFDNPAAAAELRGRVDELRRDLEQAGFQLSEDAFSFADREGSRERREAMAEGMLSAFARSAEASELADLAAQPALRVMTRLGLDVRV